MVAIGRDAKGKLRGLSLEIEAFNVSLRGWKIVEKEHVSLGGPRSGEKKEDTTS